MYEALLRVAESESVEVFEKEMRGDTKGLYGDNVIWISNKIKTLAEKACILAEELGHYYTSHGNILDQTNIVNRKQERFARKWAYEKLIPIGGFVEAYKDGVRNYYELADFLGVTEELVYGAIEHYKAKFGICTEYGDYTIHFEPLVILRKLKIKQTRSLNLKRID